MNLTDAERFAIENFVGGSTQPVDRAHQATILRGLAGREGAQAEARAIILAKRARWRADCQARQVSWATKVSRRPARGRHHDSWSIREGYVRY